MTAFSRSLPGCEWRWGGIWAYAGVAVVAKKDYLRLPHFWLSTARSIQLRLRGECVTLRFEVGALRETKWISLRLQPVSWRTAPCDFGMTFQFVNVGFCGTRFSRRWKLRLVVSVMKPRSLVGRYQRFGEAWCCCLQVGSLFYREDGYWPRRYPLTRLHSIISQKTVIRVFAEMNNIL